MPRWRLVRELRLINELNFEEECVLCLRLLLFERVFAMCKHLGEKKLNAKIRFVALKLEALAAAEKWDQFDAYADGVAPLYAAKQLEDYQDRYQKSGFALYQILQEFRQHDTEGSRKLADGLLRHFGPNSFELAMHLQVVGRNLRWKGPLEEGIRNLEDSLAILRSLPPDGGRQDLEVARIYSLLGFSYMAQRTETEKGLEYYTKQCEIYERLGLQTDQAYGIALCSIADCRARMEDARGAE